MTTPQTPLPTRLSSPEPASDTLDERILRAEQRLIAREERLRRGVGSLIEDARQQLRQRLQPQRLLLPLAGGALALGALWWFWRSRRRGSAPPAAAAPSSGRRHPVGDVGWLRLVGLAWPLLPARWRQRISPGVATTLMSLGVPLIEGLIEGLSGRSRPAPETMGLVDLARYAGTWHEVARLPAPFEGACHGVPTATYRGGPTEIEVINRCAAADGSMREARGIARPVVGSHGAKLKVSLFPVWLRWLPFAWADYWVLHVDDDYREALVGNPGRNFLWVLSRSQQMPADRLQALVQIALDQGYPVQRLKIN